MKKEKKVWTPEERKAFGEKMKAARANKGVCQPKPEVKPEEVKELSGVSEPVKVNVHIKNTIRLNGVSYGGVCNVTPDVARELKYRSDMVDEAIVNEGKSTEHPDVNLGSLSGG